jgi:hypothetical protein
MDDPLGSLRRKSIPIMSPFIAANLQPVQVEYSDLYNIMSFFSGAPSHDGTRTGREVGNDHLARVIAEAGRKFGEEHWRWVDLQGYMFRLLLEYVPHSFFLDVSPSPT